MTTYVTFAEFCTRHPGGLGDADRERAEAVLSDASGLVADNYPAEIDPADIPGVVKRLTLRVAMRVFTNPLAMTGETIGDYQWQRSPADGLGLRLSAMERRELRRAAQGGSGTRVVFVTPG
ncbi:hypothetical protein ACFVXH_40920 [Kitasatospora sp. NPDC058184]|uniref:hypothetical protein n=1 Tax=Kitasatospora sp. NPDC058184 TaxID=3346370 RepID=UPI0036DD4CF6